MIAGMTYYQICSYFIIYAFLGWCLEVVYQAVKRGKIINRGFLCGPVCPVYGFGVLAVFALTKSNILEKVGFSQSALTEGNDFKSILMVYAAGVLLATVVELVAGWLLDVLFHARWWDYSKEPFNFRGYICLRFSLIWGAAILLVVRVLQPALEKKPASPLPQKYGWIILAVLYAILLVDLIVTVSIVAGLNKKLSELDKLQQELKKPSNALSQKLGGDTIKVTQDVQKVKEQADTAQQELQARIDARKKEITGSGTFFGAKRLLNAFPDLQHRLYPESVKEVMEADSQPG